MEHSAKEAALMEIANLIVQNSGGRALLAFQEDKNTAEKVEDAAHFIKVDGVRIGRDVEFYADNPAGCDIALTMFLEEVLLSVKFLGLAESYDAAAEKLKEFGHEVFPAELHAKWDGLF